MNESETLDAILSVTSALDAIFKIFDDMEKRLSHETVIGYLTPSCSNEKWLPSPNLPPHVPPSDSQYSPSGV